jgi:putative membrane protein
MVGILLSILVTALSLLVVDILFKGVAIASFPVALISGVVIGLVNGFAKPIITVLSLPLTLVTLGAFTLVINGICLALAAFLVPGFYVHGVLAFLLAPVILAAANTFLTKYFSEKYPSLPPAKAQE